MRDAPGRAGAVLAERLIRRAGPTALTLLLGLALSGCSAAGGPVTVMQDSSMEPTYRARTMICFEPGGTIERGTVVVFEYPFSYPARPRRELVARVIGLPGDQLELGPDGVRVNGTLLAEPYAKNLDRMVEAQVTVPPGTYFVLGDDRNNQRDSRWWGPLPAGEVLGVVCRS